MATRRSTTAEPPAKLEPMLCGATSPDSHETCTFVPGEMHPERHSWAAGYEPSTQGTNGVHVFEDHTVTTPVPFSLPPSDLSSHYVVPLERNFADAEYLDAQGLRAAANALIGTDPRLSHLCGVNIDYLWRRRGGNTRGRPRLGATSMPSGLTAYYAQDATYIVWLAADHLRELDQVEAALYHQLLATDVDEEGAFRLKSCDFEGYVAEIERFGLWSAGLKAAGGAVRQLALV